VTVTATVKVPPLSRETTTSDQSGFEHLVVPCMRQLYPAAVRLTRNHSEAEDLLQETLARAYLKFGQFRTGTNVRAWLYRIMCSTFCSACRKKTARPAERLAADVQDEARPADAPAAARSAEAEALENLALSPVMRALGELPASFKTVVYLADVHGYHYAEIADIMGTPVGTVMSRAHRGRRMLRARLTRTGRRPGRDAGAIRAAGDKPGNDATVTRLPVPVSTPPDRTGGEPLAA
jgi:RNA polymerase sigma-70 factor (ECF subfamily)